LPLAWLGLLSILLRGAGAVRLATHTGQTRRDETTPLLLSFDRHRPPSSHPLHCRRSSPRLPRSLPLPLPRRGAGSYDPPPLPPAAGLLIRAPTRGSGPRPRFRGPNSRPAPGRFTPGRRLDSVRPRCPRIWLGALRRGASRPWRCPPSRSSLRSSSGCPTAPTSGPGASRRRPPSPRSRRPSSPSGPKVSEPPRTRFPFLTMPAPCSFLAPVSGAGAVRSVLARPSLSRVGFRPWDAHHLVWNLEVYCTVASPSAAATNRSVQGLIIVALCLHQNVNQYIFIKVICLACCQSH
jgi:hypothetical protein